MLLSGAINPHLFSSLLALGAAAPGVFLETPLPSPPPISAEELSSRGEGGPAKRRAAVPDLPQAPKIKTAGADRLLVPNSDGVIDLAALDSADPPGTLPNPFVVRYRPPTTVREVTLTIGGVLISARAGDACVIVNGDIYSPGDSLDGLTVDSIAADAIELHTDGVRLQIPVADAPVRLRLPH